MENNYYLIKKITEDFVFQTYNNDFPDGYCYSLCFPLSVLFSLMRFEHEITFGKAQKKKMEVSHFWISFCANGVILDPTIKQFGQNESSVYMGDIKKNDTTKKYLKIENIGDEEIFQTYESWTELLFQKNHRRPLPIDIEKKIIAINLTASLVLFFYINKYSLKEELLNSNYGLSYFKPISFAFQQDYIVDQVLIHLNKASLKYKQDIIELQIQS